MWTLARELSHGNFFTCSEFWENTIAQGQLITHHSRFVLYATFWYGIVTPVLGILVFLPKNLDFWHFLQRSWQLFAAMFARFCKIFQDCGKNPQKFLDFLARKPRISKILAREPKKILDILPKKILGFLRFLAKILAINLEKVRKNLQDFSRLWKEIQENS